MHLRSTLCLYHFLKTLVQNHMMQEISSIYDEWIHLVRASQKIAHVRIYLANPMNKEQEEKINKSIRTKI